MGSLKSKLTQSAEELRSRFGSMLTGADVGGLLEIPYAQLAYILYGSNPKYRYRTFEISKRTGGTRIIEAPHKSIAILQRKFLQVLDLVVPVKSMAHGFIPERSIMTNARPHVGRRHVLNLDLEDFFPSINFGRVRGALKARPLGLADAPASVLAHLCCHNGHLPQGAPTSPAVSNLLCRRLDSELSRLATRFGCVYTRYSDDLTFSTDAKLFPEALAKRNPDYSGDGLLVGDELRNVIIGNGFRINARKQRLQPFFRRQEVTGLTVNHRLSPRRPFGARVRAMLHAAEKFGVEAAEQEFFAKYDHRNRHSPARPRFTRVIRGRIDFISMVRGNDDRGQALLMSRLHALDPHAAPDTVVPPPRVPQGVDVWEHWHRQYQSGVRQLAVRVPEKRDLFGTAFHVSQAMLGTARHNLRGDVALVKENEAQEIDLRRALYPDGDKIDCALLVVAPQGVACLPLASELPKAGERVAAMGFPSVPGHFPTLRLASGTVAAVSRSYLHGGLEVIQLDCAVAGGMSGGPVIDQRGRVVGIVMEAAFEQTDADTPSQHFPLALPIVHLARLLAQSRAGI